MMSTKPRDGWQLNSPSRSIDALHILLPYPLSQSSQWKDLEAHFRRIETHDKFRGFRRHRDCFTGHQAVTHTLTFLHSRDEPKYKSAGRENAIGIVLVHVLVGVSPA
jgi:hypothetical protein